MHILQFNESIHVLRRRCKIVVFVGLHATLHYDVRKLKSTRWQRRHIYIFYLFLQFYKKTHKC